MLKALHPLIADGFRLHGDEHNAWEESLKVLHSVPAVTALAGPCSLRAPSTRTQQRFLQVLLSSTLRGTTILLLQLFQLLVLLSSSCCSPAVLHSPGPGAGWHCHIHMLRWLQVRVHVPGCAGITQHRGVSPVVLNFLSGNPDVACSIEAPMHHNAQSPATGEKGGCEAPGQPCCLLGRRAKAALLMAPAQQHSTED